MFISIRMVHIDAQWSDILGNVSTYHIILPG